MKFWLLELSVFVNLSVIAQPVVYPSFEVDSFATPHGGITAFNTFLLANLRKPILAESKGIGGIVVLNGVVETDGHVSDVTIMKSLRPDCDREAMRVLTYSGSGNRLKRMVKPCVSR